ncbi:MAG: HD domain-containing protein [Nitrospiraceae bacterium]|nr:HD domain-containing protein [Nitrospiraceae bacterium]
MDNFTESQSEPTLNRDDAGSLLLRLALAEHKLSLTTQRLDARNQELAAIRRLSETVGNERQITRLCETTANEIAGTLGASSVAILLLDEHTGDLVTAAATGEPPATGGPRPRVKAGDGLLWQVLKSGRPLHLPGSAAARQFTGSLASLAGLAVPIRSRHKQLGVIYACGKQDGRDFTAGEQDLLCGIANQAAVALDNATLRHGVENLYVGIAWSFAAALDAKSAWTAGHSKRVTQYAVAIAEELGLEPDVLTSVQICGLLHDIGKIAVPERLLDKPSTITHEEHRLIALHAPQGAKILEHIDSFQPLLPGIRHHHERWDGRGFPDRLQGERIPLLARILAVADAYDAMTSDRPYRKRRARHDAMTEIERCSGGQFDPRIVKAFIEVTGNRIF